MTHVRYLGNKLGYNKMEDWYKLTLKDILAQAGSSLGIPPFLIFMCIIPLSPSLSCFSLLFIKFGLVYRYRASPALLVMSLIKDHEWMPWRFRTPPPDCWENANTRIKFFKYLIRLPPISIISFSTKVYPIISCFFCCTSCVSLIEKYFH